MPQIRSTNWLRRPRNSWVAPVPTPSEWRASYDSRLESCLLQRILSPTTGGWQIVGEREQISTQVEVKTPSEFEKQREAFKEIPPLVLVPYRGQFVASRDGVIVECDTDLVELTRKFVERYGNVAVYITRIGKPIKMRTPFVR